MPSYAEIQRSVQAAWLLARGDTRGMALFDLSLEGFWKSFAAALLVAPAYAIVLLDQYSVDRLARARGRHRARRGGLVRPRLAGVPDRRDPS